MTGGIHRLGDPYRPTPRDAMDMTSDQFQAHAHRHPPENPATEALRAALRTVSLAIRAAEQSESPTGALAHVGDAAEQLRQAATLLRERLVVAR